MKVDFSVYQNLHWIIGFSGGADSRLLLELASLNRHYALSIKAIYVHHHLQSVADEWALICKNECTKLGVDFLVEHVTVPLKGSIEANAREARYNAFAKYMTPNTVLFTAHHADDLLENELLALIRGSGINGLSSMPKFRRFAQGFLARPLLSLARSEIVKECAIRGLLYVTDPTNSDCAYDRNFLRSQITPLLKERFPQILSSIIKVQENLTHEKDSYEELLSKELENIRSANAYLEGISFKKISTYSLNLQRELLRFFLKKAYNIIANRDELGQILKFGKLGSDNKAFINLGFMVSYYKDLIYASPYIDIRPNSSYILQIGKRLEFAWGYYEVIASSELFKNHFISKTNIECNVKGHNEVKESNSFKEKRVFRNFIAQNLDLNDKKELLLASCFKLSNIKGLELVLSFNIPSSTRLKPQGRNHSQIIKNLWKEYEVPLYLRSFMPLVKINDNPLGILGAFNIAKDYQSSQEGEDYYVICVIEKP